MEGSTVPCTSFAKCKTFGDCQPVDTAAAAGVAVYSDDAASKFVSEHVLSQLSVGHLVSPVLELGDWARDHVADDDALLPNLMNRQREQ